MDLKACRVLVTPTSYGRDDPALKSDLEAVVGEVIYNRTGKPLSAEQVAALLPGVDGYIAGLDEIDRRALASADRLKVIARYGVGVDGVDLQAAREKGIVVTNTPGANAVSVAELAIGLMLALARQIPEGREAIRRGGWPRLPGVTLEGKTVGILGFGAIGKAVAQRLQAFSCRLLAYDPAPDRDFAARCGVEWADLFELTAQADFLTLHLPLTPQTEGLVDRDFLRRMKPGAFLINTARGEIVDEAALAEALVSGHLRGAALDAFRREPPEPGNPLLGLPQVIAVPHLGAQTDGATRTMGRMALEDCLAVLQGLPPRHPVLAGQD